LKSAELTPREVETANINNYLEACKAVYEATSVEVAKSSLDANKEIAEEAAAEEKILKKPKLPSDVQLLILQNLKKFLNISDEMEVAIHANTFHQPFYSFMKEVLDNEEGFLNEETVRLVNETRDKLRLPVNVTLHYLNHIHLQYFSKSVEKIQNLFFDITKVQYKENYMSRKPSHARKLP
jgi:hypothetical protein